MIMTLAGVYLSIAIIAGIACIIIVFKNKDVLFPKHKQNS